MPGKRPLVDATGKTSFSCLAGLTGSNTGGPELSRLGRKCLQTAREATTPSPRPAGIGLP